jgi:hypothetical protein
MTNTKELWIKKFAKIVCSGCIENETFTCSFPVESTPCYFATNFAEALYNAPSLLEDCTRAKILEETFTIVKEVIDSQYALETPSTRATLSKVITQIGERFAKEFGAVK